MLWTKRSTEEWRKCREQQQVTSFMGSSVVVWILWLNLLSCHCLKMRGDTYCCWRLLSVAVVSNHLKQLQDTFTHLRLILHILPAASSSLNYPYSSHVGQWVIPAQALKSGVVEASSVVPFQVAAQRSSNGAVGKFGADQATEVGYPPVYYVLQPSYAGQSPFYAPAFQPYSQQVVLDGLTPLVYQQQPFFRTVGGLPPSLSVPLPPPANHGQCWNAKLHVYNLCTWLPNMIFLKMRWRRSGPVGHSGLGQPWPSAAVTTSAKRSSISRRPRTSSLSQWQEWSLLLNHDCRKTLSLYPARPGQIVLISRQITRSSTNTSKTNFSSKITSSYIIVIGTCLLASKPDFFNS